MRSGVAKPDDFIRVIVDTTVQPTAISFPIDAMLVQHARERLASLAQESGIKLRLRPAGTPYDGHPLATVIPPST